MKTISIVVICLFVGLAVCHPPRRTGERRPERQENVGEPGKAARGKTGRPGPLKRIGKSGRPQRKQLSEEHSEKLFFCQMAHRACKLVEEGEEPLVDRTCYSEAACDGPSGTITLNGTDYTITFCTRPEEELDEDERIQRMLNRERPEPNEALQEICKPPRKEREEGSEKPERKPRWFHQACKVSNATDDLRTRECKGDANCTKGPYDVKLGGVDVEVTFCEREEKEETEEETEDEDGDEEAEGEEDEDDKKDEPFWYANSCQVKDGEETVKELDDCPGDLECITRLTDMDYDGKKVDAGYCGGFLLRQRGGKHGGRRGPDGFTGQFRGNGRQRPRGEREGQEGGKGEGRRDGSRPGKGDENRPGKGDENRPGKGDGSRPGKGDGSRPGKGDGSRPERRRPAKGPDM